MFLDARNIPDGARIDTDVCIIGAGPAGITIARELIGSGRRLLLLESGGLETDPGSTALSMGAATGQPYFELAGTRSRVFGGTTDQWAGECRPLDADDFERHSWIPDSGWPFGRNVLLPYYERARPLLELGSAPFEADDWGARGGRPLRGAAERIRTVALHYSPPTHFGVAYRRELEEAENVTVCLGATAVELETPATPTRVSSVRAATLAGSGFRVVAPIFVLAAGGIESPRLLLASNQSATAGLGNGYDLVGRYFMEHLFIDEAALLRSSPGTFTEFFTCGADLGGGRVRGMVDLQPEARRRERIANVAALLSTASAEASILAARYVAFETLKGRPPVAGPVRLGSALRHVASERFGRRRATRGSTHFLKQVIEQVPNPDSRIVLTRERDALGVPRVELRWRLSPIDKHTAHSALAVLRGDLAAAGVRFTTLIGRDADPWPVRLRGARHHMGTTRMHADPERGVVDPDCRVHGIANLYIAGSSVFPTGGAANPTLTIVALALRLADCLRASIGE